MREVPGSAVVTTAIVFRAGTRDETAGLGGAAHFLEHMMFKGSEHYGPGEVDRRTQALGGSNNAFTAHDVTAYHFSFAADRWTEGLAIEADRMRGLTLDPEEVESERQVIVEEIAMYDDEPWDALELAVLADFYGDHAYGKPVLGTREDLARTGPAELRSFQEHHYRPNRAALVIAGGVDADEAIARAREAFGDVPGTASGAGAVRGAGARARTPPARTAARRSGALALGDAGAGGERARTRRAPRAVVAPREWTGERTSSNAGRGAGALSLGLRRRPRNRGAVGLHARLRTPSRSRARGGGGTRASRTRTPAARAARLRGDRAGAQHPARRLGLRTRQGAPASAGARSDRGALRHRPSGSPTPADRRGERRRRPRGRGALSGSRGVFDDRVVLAAEDWKKHECSRRLEEARALRDSLVLVARLRIRTRHVAGAPVVAVRVVVVGGGRREAIPGQALLAGRGLGEGTARRDWARLAEDVEARGMSAQGFAGWDAHGLAVDALAHDFDRALEVAAEMLLEPIFPEPRVDLLRKQCEGELSSLADQADVLTGWAFVEDLYGSHPLARRLQGTPESLAALTDRDARDFHAAGLGGQIIVTVAGEIDEASIRDRIEQAFARLAELPTTNALPTPGTPEPDRASRRVVETSARDQAHLYVGQLSVPRGHADGAALDVLSVIVGAGAGLTGRVPSRVREDEGLAYTAFATMVSGAGLDPGRLAAYVGTSPATVERAERAVIEELVKLREGGVTDAEVADAKAYLIGRDPFRRETARQWADLLAESELYQRPYDDPNYLIDRIRAVDRPTVEAAGQKVDPAGRTDRRRGVAGKTVGATGGRPGRATRTVARCATCNFMNPSEVAGYLVYESVSTAPTRNGVSTTKVGGVGPPRSARTLDHG